MKRSEINNCIVKAIAFAKKMNMKLPPFAFWPAQSWKGKGEQVKEIKDLMLGWDVTDFNRGDYFKMGRTLFTLRNGSYRYPQYKRTYSEKFIFIEEEQASPVHFHRKKTEDIINRGGGNINIRSYKATTDGEKSDESFYLSVDGVPRLVKPGEIIRLTPGESVLVPSGIIHEFWSEKGTGMTLSGEIGSVCDDVNDNIFLVPCDRFCSIEEDVPALHLLCNEYP